MRAGQPFADVLTWHPRDVDTVIEIFDQQDSAAREERMAAARARINANR